MYLVAWTHHSHKKQEMPFHILIQMSFLSLQVTIYSHLSNYFNLDHILSQSDPMKEHSIGGAFFFVLNVFAGLSAEKLSKYICSYQDKWYSILGYKLNLKLKSKSKNKREKVFGIKKKEFFILKGTIIIFFR